MGNLVTLRSSGGLPERPMGADCKSAGYAFSGSNPLPTTKFSLEEEKIKMYPISQCSLELVEQAASKLRSGAVVAFPTETV